MIQRVLSRVTVLRHRDRRAKFTVSSLVVASAFAVALAGCGSSSSSSTTSTSTTSSTTQAAASKATVVKGTPSPAGAVAPSKAGLAKLKPVPKGVRFSPHLKGLDNVPITQAIPVLSGDMNAFWSQEFANSGVQWPTVQDVLVQTSPASTQCSDHPTVAPTDPMLLCYGPPATFFWTIPWMQQNVDTDAANVNLLLGMASMYGYAVQDLFGVYKQVQAGQVTNGQVEQQDLCLAGIYARSVDQRGLFESADINTVNKWLSSLQGDSSSGGATAQQLQQAFVAGYNSGMPSTCGVQGGGGTPTTPTTTTPTTPTPTTTTSGPTLTTP